MAEVRTKPARSATISACEACRSLKMKCTRIGSDADFGDDNRPCDRCRNNNRSCNRPPSRPLGRKPGSLGRYKGVEKALRKVQSELRKSKTISTDSVQTHPELLQLTDGNEQLLNLLLPSKNTDNDPTASDTRINPPTEPMSIRDNLMNYPLEPLPDTSEVVEEPSDSTPSYHGHTPISNPLGLVADAYEEAEAFDLQSQTTSLPSPLSTTGTHNFPQISSRTSNFQDLSRSLLRRPGYVSLGLGLSRQTLELGLDALLSRQGQSALVLKYFKTADPAKARDVGPEFDPVDLGLVSMAEAHYLFPVYFARLHPINGILDPKLHTPDFVRSRSALLFTWILTIAAQFDHSSGAIFKRLRHHGEYLSKHVYANGFKSVEIAQGYYISLLCAVPAATLADERVWLYTNYAFGMAKELGLDKHAQEAHPTKNGHSKRADSSSSASRRAMDPRSLVSFEQHSHRVETSDLDLEYRERLGRNRQRTWLRIVLWERSHSSARGQFNSFPETELTENINTWYIHPLAHAVDRFTCGFILLRQSLATLHDLLGRQTPINHAARHWVRELVDANMQQWRNAWLKERDPSMTRSDLVSSTVLRYVYMHGRLWTLSHALRLCKHGAEDAEGLTEDCFEAAVNCCEIVVQDMQEVGEPLYCMMAPNWTMITYTAVLALKLFPMLYGTQANRAVELLALLAQVALQLEKAGSTPPHRFGMAALLGQHLFMILRTRTSSLKHGDDGHVSNHMITSLRPSPNANLGAEVTNSLDDQFRMPADSFDSSFLGFDPFVSMPFDSAVDDFTSNGFADDLWQYFTQSFADPM